MGRDGRYLSNTPGLGRTQTLTGEMEALRKSESVRAWMGAEDTQRPPDTGQTGSPQLATSAGAAQHAPAQDGMAFGICFRKLARLLNK